MGTGHHVPERVLSNADLERMVDTSDEWITERTGIKERRITTAEEATSDMAHPAARRALEEVGFPPDKLDAIVCATATPDNPFPATAVKLQALLGADNAFAFDVGAACAGWIYALAVAQGLYCSDFAKHILVVGAECLSKITDWTDRSTCVLFGDGAGAVLLGPASGDAGLLSICLATEGRHYDLLYQPAGGSRLPASAETVERRQHVIRMNGNEVFKFAVRRMVDLSVAAIEEAGLALSDIDLFISHQANRRIIDQTAKRLGLPEDRVLINLDRYGNTSAASIPMALDEARRTGRVAAGSAVCVVAFGGGFTFGSAVIRL
jgi:3-oxoacyl-[acyl-carrier-protein] synthase-3